MLYSAQLNNSQEGLPKKSSPNPSYQHPETVSHELQKRLEEARVEYQRGEYVVLDDEFFENL